MDVNPKKSTGHPANRRRDPARFGESPRWLRVTREVLGHHFDLVVVIWVLALAVAWSVVVLSKPDLSRDPWSSPQNGTAWVSSSGATGP